MALARQRGSWARGVRFSVAAMVVALFGAATVVQAACTNCTWYGTGALNNGLAGGTNESAFGVDALKADSGGSDNTATGWNALLNNTTGVANTATGGVALSHNTTGNANTATGWDALFSNTTGIENTATGHSALNVNTTGVENTATGWYALLDNTTGGNNTARGPAPSRATPRAMATSRSASTQAVVSPPGTTISTSGT